MTNIYIKTFGCALNQSDSELMAGMLKKEGHKIVDDETKADVVIINSCTVKNEAETKFFREIEKHKNKKIILAGCIPQAEKSLIESKLKNYSIIGTSQISKIGLVVEQTLLENKVVMIEKSKNKRLNLPKIRKNELIEIIPISEGCLGACTYCKTKQARGELFSYSEDEILKELETAVKNGVKEIFLTSQDLGAYGKDINSNLPRLLKKLSNIKGDFKIRLGMCNPNFAIEYLDELKEILKHEKFYKFIHLPVQAGSDETLKKMGRKYLSKDFEKVVKTLRKEIPNITIATDIIVGFPTESDEDFKKTLNLLKSTTPDVINMSRFWKRPGTFAFNMKQLDTKIIKKRSLELKEVCEKIMLEQNKKWINWEGEVLVQEIGKNNTLTCRNYSYKTIVLDNNNFKLGQKVNVKINSATKWDLRAKILDTNN